MAVLRIVSEPFLPAWRGRVGVFLAGMCAGLLAALPVAIFIVRIGL